MHLTDIGQVVASRMLTLTDNNSNRLVTVSIGRPEKFTDSEGFYCPFKITGLGDESVNWCGGIDEVQSLLLALERIGIVLTDTDEYKQGNLVWVGSDKGKLGFPHTDSSEMLSDLHLLSDR